MTIRTFCQVEQEVAKPTVVRPTANPDQFVALATELLSREDSSDRDALDARLLTATAAEKLPDNPHVLDLHSRALGSTGEFAEGLANVEQLIANQRNADRHWQNTKPNV